MLRHGLRKSNQIFSLHTDFTDDDGNLAMKTSLVVYSGILKKKEKDYESNLLKKTMCTILFPYQK